MKNIELNRSGIYKITNLINGKLLIGLTENLNKRWYEHKSALKNNRHKNPHLQNAWNQYGEQNFKYEVIIFCPIDRLSSEEIRLIEKYNTMDRNFGYNIAEGGFRPKMSKETREKLSIANTGKKATEETKQKMSKWQIGRKMSEETKKRMSAAHKGKTISEEQKVKISKANSGKNHPNYGKRLSEETKRKLSEVRRGEKNHFYGKHHSEETKIKMRQAKLGKHHSEETKRKMREAHVKKYISLFS